MPTPTLDTRPDGALVIEADTAAEALTQIGARLGDDAEILAAEKVHRGGWQGFFARERVQLVARGRVADGGPDSSGPAPTVDAGGGDGVAAALAALTREAEAGDTPFHEVLARQFAVPAAPPAPAAAPVPDAPPAAAAVPPPTVRVAPRAGTPQGVRWDVDQLRDLRVPAAIVGACEHLDPADDTAWVMAIAATVSSWCRPLPQGRSILVGPRAHRLGRALQLRLVEPGRPVGRAGSVALKLTDSANGRGQLAQLRGDRWGHLVAGGSRWEGFLLEDVAAVSWVGDDTLPDALEAASRLGLVLGYGLGTATGPTPVRATPIDVALVLRSLVPRDVR